MEDYESSEFELTEDWASRFPQDAIGFQQLRGVPFSPEGNVEAWRRISRLAPAKRTGPSIPRLFVSHRQANRNEAMRAAWMATRQGYYFWLDVLNPKLRGFDYQALPPKQQAFVTAIVIEMGLLNSSHVLAIVTPDTAGSQWVPYEYGRVKQDVLFSTQAGCWNHPKRGSMPRAEYLDLGVDTHSEAEVRQWLGSEFKAWSGVPRPWRHGSTTPLPT